MADPNPNPEGPPQGKTVSIGTWNMDHWKRTVQQRRDAWVYLDSKAGADIMLLQESGVPTGLPRTRYVHRELAGSRPWGSAVVAFSDAEDLELEEIDAVRSRYSSRRFSMLGSNPGTVIVARVDFPGIGPITCISVYGAINVYAQTTMFRIVADLIPLFDSSDGKRVVLGGDFNVTDAIRGDATVLPRWRAILNAVESLGLVNLAKVASNRPPSIPGCLCAEEECFHLHTYTWGGNQGTQLDWLYATPDLANHCTRIRLDHEVFGKLSDHAPIVADFNVVPDERPRIVDPDSFVEVLAARSGPECARIAEELINWALRKHETLRRGERRFATYDRFDISSRVRNPQMWFQLDLDYPDDVQWTFSLTTDGNVCVQFQFMKSPFDRFEARKRIWNEINQIPGVDLDQRLRGRPTIPIRCLASTETCKRFERVFSDMIDETLRERLNLT
ncbi:MAG: hypothetical protein F4Y38_03225 [Gemmatimonadetes bacterium]|nr:hypothetical protein [Gemmatimonadota bacterium]